MALARSIASDPIDSLEAISSLPPGKVAVLKLLRNQQEVVLQVKVGRRPKPRIQEQE